MKNVLIFTSSYPFGGGEAFFLPELMAWAKCGYKATLVPFYYSGSDKERFVPSEVSFIDKPLVASRSFLPFLRGLSLWPGLLPMLLLEFVLRRVFVDSRRLRAWFLALINTPIALGSLNSLAILEDASICYFYWGNNAAFLVPWIKKRYPSMICVVRNHGSDLYEYQSGGYLPLKRSVFSMSDRLVFISSNGLDYCRSAYPSIPKERMWVSRLGSSPPRNGGVKIRNDGHAVVVSCSNIIPLKNVDKIARAVALLGKPVVWHHFGGGPCQGQVEAIIADFAQGTIAIMHGHVENAEIQEFYSTHEVNVFVNASDSEGLPVSIMEAMSYGIPVCAPDVGGIHELVSSKVGVLMGPKPTCEELASAISEILELSENKKEALSKTVTSTWKELYDADENAQRVISAILTLDSGSTRS